jgi:hypothetical protein
MISDREKWLAAMKMIARYGRDAIVEAGDRADQCLKDGDVDGSDDWQRIMIAVSQLQAEKPAPGETVQ